MTDPDRLSVDTAVRLRRRATLAGCIGTIVEYYDFGIYAYFASVISKQFFPTHSAITGLLLTFGAFATSYVVRPLGAVIFGNRGDKRGRRNTLSVIIVMMALATALIGLLPGYNQIGVVAPIALTLARLIQGMSAGGEYSGASSFIAEYAPIHRRGFYMGWLCVAIGLGLLSGAVVATAFTSLLSPASLQSWGWRVPFLIALPLGLVGLYIRRQLSETPEFASIARAGRIEKSPVLTSLRREYPIMLLTIGLVAGSTVATYLFLTYSPTYLSQILGYRPVQAQVANVIALIAYCVAIPPAAMLSDRFGRRPVLIGASVLLAALSYPGLLLIGQRNVALAVVVLAVLGALSGASGGAFTAQVAEVFATSTRYSGLGIGWNLTAMIFGGASPLIATGLIAGTGSVYSPAFYAIFGAVLSVIAAIVVKETYRTPLRPDHGSSQVEEPEPQLSSTDSLPGGEAQ